MCEFMGLFYGLRYKGTNYKVMHKALLQGWIQDIGKAGVGGVRVIVIKMCHTRTTGFLLSISPPPPPNTHKKWVGGGGLPSMIIPENVIRAVGFMLVNALVS